MVKYCLTDEAKRLGIQPPSRGYLGEDAGVDLRALHDVVVPPQAQVDVPTGVIFEIPDDYFGLVCNRTSMAKKGIVTVYQVVDPGYVGLLTLRLYNINQRVACRAGDIITHVPEVEGGVEVRRGDRVAQIVFIPAWMGQVVETTPDKIKQTRRGAGKEGSTGR